MLWCDCEQQNPRVHVVGGCPIKAAVRYWRQRVLRQELSKERNDMLFSGNENSMEDFVMALFERHLAGEFIGQEDASALYYQTLAPILDVSEQYVAKIADRLFRQQRIGLTGALMLPWSSDFEPKDDPADHLDDARPPAGEAVNVRTDFYAETGTEGGYWATQETGKTGYDGLHTLKTGDWIEILDPQDATRVLWNGYIRLRHYPLFTEDANGMWIHTDQTTVKREQWAAWFQQPHPARLIPQQ